VPPCGGGRRVAHLGQQVLDRGEPLGDLVQRVSERKPGTPGAARHAPHRDAPEFLGRRCAHGRDHLRLNPVQARALPHQDLGADAVTLADEPEQDVLGADVVIPEPLRLAEREFEHLLGARGERDVLARPDGALPDDLHDLLPDRVQADLQRAEGPRGQALGLAEQAEQDVLGADVVVAERPGFLLGLDHDPAGLVGEPFEHLRTPRVCVGAVQEA
jgi:hypothetical protein